MPVDFHPEALAEARHARRQLETARPGYGRRFNLAFTAALERLDRTPRLFAPDDDAPPAVEVRYVYLKRYKYRVIFAVFGETKLVVAVAHTSREPGYWLDRLPPAT